MPGSKKNRRGGAGAASPSSYSDAQSYERATVGTPNMQYNNVFGMNARGHPNAIQGLQGQVAGRRRTRAKKGGVWGQVINQAIVPFGILGMQQSYGRRKSARFSRSKRRRFTRRRR